VAVIAVEQNENRHRSCHADMRPECRKREVVKLFRKNRIRRIGVDVKLLRQLASLLLIAEHVPGSLPRALGNICGLLARRGFCRLRRSFLEPLACKKPDPELSGNLVGGCLSATFQPRPTARRAIEFSAADYDKAYWTAGSYSHCGGYH
jgi:hypothetical protein